MADTLRHLDPYGGRAKPGQPVPTTPLWRQHDRRDARTVQSHGPAPSARVCKSGQTALR